MKLFDFLFHRAPSIETPAPLIVVHGVPFVPSDAVKLEEADNAEHERVIGVGGERLPSGSFPSEFDLENIYCIIEYVDSRGNETSRRITMISLHNGPTGSLVHAVCHERKAIRHFRVDRIKSIITADGEVFSSDAFFKEFLGVEVLPTKIIEETSPVGRPPLVLSSARDLREHLRAPLSILVCAAMADDNVHIEEIDRIQLYAETEIYTLHREGRIADAPTVEIMDQLCRMICTMRPQRRSMRGYVERVCEWPEHRVKRLTKALGQVIAADGRIVLQEYAFLDEMDTFAKASQHERFGMLASAEAIPFEDNA